MKNRMLFASFIIFFCENLQAQETPTPFVAYPGPVGDYLKRIQRGKQRHAFNASADFGKWRKHARQALIELTGLKQMEQELAEFKPKVQLGKADVTKDSFTRTLCSIETEPGVVVPFYLLVPKGAKKDKPRPFSLARTAMIN